MVRCGPAGCYFLPAVPVVWECGDSDQVCTVQWCTAVVCTLRYSYTGFHLPPAQRSAMTPPPLPAPPDQTLLLGTLFVWEILLLSDCCRGCWCGEARTPDTSHHLYILLHWVSLPGSGGAVEWSPLCCLASLAAATCISVWPSLALPVSILSTPPPPPPPPHHYHIHLVSREKRGGCHKWDWVVTME